MEKNNCLLPYEKINLFIFDLQQTLLNDYQAHLEAHTKILKEMDRPNVDGDLDEIRHLWGKRVFDVYRHLFGGSISEEKTHELVKRRDDHYVKIFSRSEPVLCEGARDLLTELKKAGYNIAVSSGIRRQLVEVGLRNSGLMKYVDYYNGAEDVKNGKPAPDCFLLAASNFNIAPQNALAIGDSFLDVEAAKNGGMISAGVATGFTTKEKLYSSGADAVFSSLTDLLTDFKRFENNHKRNNSQ